MNILVFSSAFPPHVFGGGEIAAFNLSRLLVRRGHTVSVATMLEHGAEPSWGSERSPGVRLYTLDCPRSHTYFSRNATGSSAKKLVWHAQDYFDPRNPRLVRRLLDEVRPDHVDIHNIVGIGFNVLPEIARAGCSTAFFLHDLSLACFYGSMFRDNANCAGTCKSCGAVGSLRRKALASVQRLGFISPSQTNLDRLRPHAEIVRERPATVVRNVMDDVPDLPPREASPRPRLLFVGRLEAVKGIEFLLEVLEQVAVKHDFHLTVLGTGKLEESLRGRYGDRRWVTFEGFVPHQQVARAMANSDLFCMPSLWAEPYGLVTAQALQNSTPVVGSNIGGTTEIVRHGETGLLLEPGDREAWAAAFCMLLTDTDLLHKWRENASGYAHEFSNDHIGERYESFIAQL